MARKAPATCLAVKTECPWVAKESSATGLPERGRKLVRSPGIVVFCPSTTL